MKLAARNGDIAEIWMDSILADKLRRYLEKIFLGEQADPGRGPRVRALGGVREPWTAGSQRRDRL